MAEQITILGDGAMATVCSILLTSNGHRVTMWGAFEESIERLMQDREQRRLLPSGCSIVLVTALVDDDLAGGLMTLAARHPVTVIAVGQPIDLPPGIDVHHLGERFSLRDEALG